MIRSTLPHIVGPAAVGASGVEELSVYVERQREELGAYLLAHGAVLFRGFEIDGVHAFTHFVRAFSGTAEPFGYAGGASPRVALGEGSYSSTEYPPHLALALHNELSYSDRFPRHLFFTCLVEPESGGETTLGDSRRILARIDPQLLATFRAKGVRYVRNLSGCAGSGYSWKDAFETCSPEVAERACRAMGADFAWSDDGSLHVSQTRTATTVHPETDEEVWFNQADGFHPSALDPETYAALIAECGSEDRLRLNVSYGDGSPIEHHALDEIRAVLSAETVAHAWRRGDVLVLDNLLAAHGRRPFAGPRRIALAMR